ncbi:GGDEF domain-containing protein [Cognatilysobacter bugurensis]|uniref:diguanylate cyclase n=1 Tax=Cognatilysobacter bugurensis TaxID=543356 RepID=A0A918SZN4_9GAMM|nr:GGDEF domain-containing protein [Lysobacter bugurensis]GHA79493.1 GGDEF domain-containing protein [Lysobacter bugurensis]
MPAAPALNAEPAFRHVLQLWIGRIGIVALIVIAALRFAAHQPAAAWVDVGWAAGLALALGWLHWRGPSMAMGTAMSALSLAASMLKVDLLGMPGLFWLFPVILGSFAIAPRPWACGLALLATLYAGVRSLSFAAFEVAATFVAAAGLVIVVAWVGIAYFEALRQRLEHIASQDALTGAGNRRALEAMLRRLSPRQVDHRPFALAVLDLDHFKQVNDRHGHAAGDRALADFARLVRQLVRPQDRLYRYGGEEFVLVMPDITTADAAGLMELVNAAVRQKIRVRDRPLTVSIGLAMHRPGETADAWLARADAAVYRAKSEGRDRVVNADPAAEPAAPSSRTG